MNPELNILFGIVLITLFPGYASHYAGELAYFFRFLSSNILVLAGFAAYLAFSQVSSAAVVRAAHV